MSNIRISELDQVAATKLLIDGVFPFSQKNVNNNDALTTYKATFQQLLDLLTTLNSSTYLLPPGLIMPYGGSETAFNLIRPFNGWKICNGAQISKVDYSALFAVIGTTYGGANVNQALFSLPDLRGRTLIGAGQSGSLTNRILGISDGDESVNLSTNQIPSHNHAVLHLGSHTSFATGNAQTAYDSYQGGSNFISVADDGFQTGNRGGSQSHNNMQPYTAINYIIKT